MPFEPKVVPSDVVLTPPPSISEGQFRWTHDTMKTFAKKLTETNRAIREMQEWIKNNP